MGADRLASFLLATALVVSACSLEGFMEAPHGVIILNDLDQSVTLRYDGTAGIAATLGAHTTTSLRFDTVWDDESRQCTTSDIVIVGANEVELGRIPPPACVDRTYTLRSYVPWSDE